MSGIVKEPLNIRNNQVKEHNLRHDNDHKSTMAEWKILST